MENADAGISVGRGVDEIQGFLFSPGVPVAQIEEFLRNKKSL